MELAFKRSAKSWDDLRRDLEEQLAQVQREESAALKMSAKAIPLCSDVLHQVNLKLLDYHFSAGEEVQFYKEIKPWFLSRFFYYNRLHNLEMRRITAGAASSEAVLHQVLGEITKVFEQNLFIYQYLKSGATHLDGGLFFHPTAQSVTAIIGADFPCSTPFPVCYDYVAGHLQAAEMLRSYVEQALEDSRQVGIGAPGLPRLTWTDSKTALTEWGYALHAAGAFNNGKIDLKEVMDFLQAVFHCDLGHYPRTFQEILSRKTGYTNAIDRYRDKLLLRIQKIESKYDR